MAAATDNYGSHSVPPYGPCRHAAAVTPADDTDLTNVTRALYITTAGNLVVITQGGETVTIPVTNNSWLWLAVSRVKLSTASGITAFW